MGFLGILGCQGILVSYILYRNAIVITIISGKPAKPSQQTLFPCGKSADTIDIHIYAVFFFFFIYSKFN